MKKIWLFLALSISIFCPISALAGTEETLSFGRFGKVSTYRQTEHPSNAVLFVSGDGGWNLGVVDMARELAALDTLVIGIDITHYLKQIAASDEKCSYPAADFEALSQYIQKKLDFPGYINPVLVGYSSGATLVYAILAQAPSGTFAGAVSMGFCPDLLLSKPLCKGSGLEWKTGAKGKGYIFLPAKHLQTQWVAFQGTVDQVCDPAATADYVKQVSHGEIVMLPKVGHGFSVPKNWMPQLKEAFKKITGRHENGQVIPAHEISDLPLTEVLTHNAASDTMAVIISGDGGWAGIDKDMAGSLAEHGIPVAGVNSLQYFWTERTPDGAARDLERILRHYLAAWAKDKIILAGYSLGAEVLPFMANRLPQDILSRVSVIALLAPGSRANFQFHLSDWLTVVSRITDYQVLPEVRKLKGKKILCFYGADEKSPFCRDLDQQNAKSIALGGGHHFGGNYKEIADAIMEEAE